MYGKNDLRASLAPSAEKVAMTPFKPASYGRFYEEMPVEESELASTWLTRGQNLIVAYSAVRSGAVLARSGQIDEYAVVLPDAGLSVEITAGGQTETAHGPCVAFIPPGDSSVRALGDGGLYRLITTRSADLAARCANAGDFATPDLNVPEFTPWPDPVGGWRIRVYSGDVPSQPGRFGRIYRCTTIMVNLTSGRAGPRDPADLSPHHHDDFEQYSIATAGEFIHHLRWPWTGNSAHWLEDQHAYCAAPSVAVIPPPATHTSQGMSTGLNRLADVFCPPRHDFSAREGWVLNAADYPAPDPAP
ncbi:hypothetical protein FBZ91_12050 [Nitrospirillum viridazoti]|uniref:5-deoxy-glucuronate isomerase n=2 Tax=Nitrospirillum TaxID=1543705 RepID=A0A248K205_9PROT|nr:hypothetical protein Y958_28960 [Nitrospirillum amazonense CBAmc]TWB31242.1 hypothetical protein FBZ91_12050 [Nitrospirillum amazonense]